MGLLSKPNPAMGGQRVQRHERGDGILGQRQREFADERESVRRVQFDVFPTCRQHGEGSDGVGHRLRE